MVSYARVSFLAEPTQTIVIHHVRITVSNVTILNDTKMDTLRYMIVLCVIGFPPIVAALFYVHYVSTASGLTVNDANIDGPDKSSPVVNLTMY